MTTTRPARHSWFFRLLLGVCFGVLLLLALAVMLVAIPLTRRLLLLGLAKWMLGGRLESLAVDLDIQPNLRWIFSLLVILPVGFGLARMAVARGLGSAARGLALAMGTLLGVGILAWCRTRHFNFDAQGRPIVYLSFRRDGVHKSYSPGFDRVTGRPRVPVTPARALWFSDLVRQPVREVAPAVETNWFDATSGEPNLWYIKTGSNQWHFYNRPHFQQQLGVPVKPITREVMAEWQAFHDQEVAATQALQRQQEAAARAAADRQAREELDRLEPKKRLEQRRLEQQREAGLRIRAEAEARARLEADQAAHQAELRRARAEARAREEAVAQARQVAAEHHRQVIERRIREATAAPSSLDQWDARQFVSGVFPALNAHHPDTNAFDDQFAGRRFQFCQRVETLERRDRRVEFAPLIFGDMGLRVSGLLGFGSTKAFKRGHEVHFVGTVERIETSSGPDGSMVTLWLSGIESVPGPVIPVFKITEPTPARAALTFDSANPLRVAVFGYAGPLWPAPTQPIRQPSRSLGGYYTPPVSSARVVPRGLGGGRRATGGYYTPRMGPSHWYAPTPSPWSGRRVIQSPSRPRVVGRAGPARFYHY